MLVAVALLSTALGVQLALGLEHRTDRFATVGAGRVLNGTMTQNGAVAAIDTMVAANQPEVVVLGNSVAWADTHIPTLARMLNLPPQKVNAYAMNNAGGPHWYAVLKNRIVATGHVPRLVVVVSPLQPMVEVVPPTPGILANLEAQMAPDEPVLRPLISNGRSIRTTVDRLGASRARARNVVLDFARSLGGLGQGEDAEARVAQVDRAWRRTVANNDRDLRLPTPVIAADGGGRLFPSAASLPEPEDSVLPHLFALARQHGIQLVLVRPPLAPYSADSADAVRPGTREAIAELARSYDAVFLDLSWLDFGPQHFRDLLHLHPGPSVRFTRALGASLIRMGAGQRTHEFRQVPPLLAVDAPASVNLLAGGPLTWTVQSGWGLPDESFAVRVLTSGPDAATVRVAGERVPMTPSPGGIWQAWYTEVAPDPPWTIEVEDVPGSSRMQAVVIGRGAVAQPVWGHAPTAGRRALLPSATVEAAAPWPWDVADNQGRSGTVSRAMPGVGGITDARDRMLGATGGVCLPAGVVAAGQRLPGVRCADLFTGTPGACWDGERLHARAPVPVAMADYALVRPEPVDCAGGLWLGAGDVARVPLPAHDRPGQLEIALFGPPESELDLSASDGGGALGAPLTVGARGSGQAEWHLERVADGGEVVLRNAGIRPILVGSLGWW